jgi:hypothetical protein
MPVSKGLNVEEIDRAISLLPVGVAISFVRCPGHAAIHGNELTDRCNKKKNLDNFYV